MSTLSAPVYPQTQERSLLELLPALPARLSPRRLPRTVRARRAITRLVYGGRSEARFFVLLAVAVVGAGLFVLAGLPQWDAVDGAR